MIRRGSNEIRQKEDQSISVYRFKVGDLVTPYFAPHADFFGEVVDINPVEDKIYVDFQGTVRQMDPNEIRIVLKQKIMENFGFSNNVEGGRRAKKLTAGMKKAIYYYLPGKIYKITKKEQGGGNVMRCPKCKRLLKPTKPVENEACFLCIGCGFKIQKNKLV